MNEHTKRVREFMRLHHGERSHTWAAFNGMPLKNPISTVAGSVNYMINGRYNIRICIHCGKVEGEKYEP